MSSPARPFVQVAAAGKEGNVRKRLFVDSDSEQREAKKPKPQNDDELRRDTKEKKKRRKKKRKLSVVQSQPLDASKPEEHVAPIASQSRSRSRSVTLAGSSSISPEPHTKQNAPSCACASTSAMASREPSPSHSSSSKGKGRATDEDMAPQASQQEITDLKDQVSAKTTLVSQHEDLLSTFQQSLSCQICLDLMHRPFALAPCGHSACYQCLLNWFKAAPPDVPANELLPVWLRKKTCPHCRAVVKERPIEIWTIKEMVASLVKSGLATALLPPPEQAADAAGDPWAGIFRPSANQLHGVFPDGQPPALLQQVMGLRDDEDGGIYRCIDCHHEIWDGACSECGRVYPGHNPDGAHPDELDDADDFGHWDLRRDPFWDEEDDEEDEDYLEEYGANWAGLDMLRQLFFPAPRYRHEDEDGDSASEGGGSHHSDDGSVRIEEVDGDAEHGDGGSEDGYESSFIDDGDDVAGRRRAARRRAPSVDLDQDEVIELSDDDDADFRPAPAPPSEADEVQYVGHGRRRGALAGRARGPIVITSDEEEDDVDGPYGAHHIVSEDEEDAEGLAAEVAAREREMYGDDGSVPRRGARYEDAYPSDEEAGDVSDYGDSYHSDEDEYGDPYSF
ncbi:hypothetical protein C8Q73DRAFT_777516 [Cubamyces lactineus]|nr:hypothetical protein C8Q73DRAFT_777516 [Cubamyces lactineus]